MICAENALVKGAKVGGVADVIAGVCPALKDQGCKVQILMPSYGVLHEQVGAQFIDSVSFPFYGQHHEVQLYWAENAEVGHVPTWFVHHSVFTNTQNRGQIYIHDDAANPFASDATRFALFCSAVAEIIKIGLIREFNTIHLHDWQSAFLLFLKTFEPHYQRQLSKYNYVYSIHNLGYQGIRPLDNHASSLKAWWPHLHVIDHRVRDPRYDDCFNPMAMAIRLADKLHTVSPTYSQEILKSSNHIKGYYGGEGLEQDLQSRAIEGDLVGIINGCVYNEKKKILQPKKAEILKQAYSFSLRHGPKMSSVDNDLHLKLKTWEKSHNSTEINNQFICTSVGRLSTQKIALLLQPVSKNQTALESMLTQLGDQGLFFLVGSGDAEIEDCLSQVSQNFDNFFFINGYAQDVADAMYQNGDLFIMPSQYEPCGISQMLAMREGQLCLVHATGGLKDTVIHKIDGFSFGGANPQNQAKAFIKQFDQAMSLFRNDKKSWINMTEKARQKRFLWSNTAKAYCQKLYS